VLSAQGNGAAVRLNDLLDSACFDREIDPYQRRFPGVDRRALVSLWSLSYLSMVGIGVMVAGVVYNVRLPLALSELSVLHDQDGRPSALVLPHAGLRSERPVGADMLQALVFEHCAPLVDAIARGQKVSKRMLWTNLAVYLDWILREIGAHIGAEAVAESMAALQAPHFSNGMINPLHGLLRPENGSGEPRRKVCCLRYCVPGVGGCGGVCPLPEGRASTLAVAAE
jgi:ferric iron reductase protein FhuF